MRIAHEALKRLVTATSQKIRISFARFVASTINNIVCVWYLPSNIPEHFDDKIQFGVDPITYTTIAEPDRFARYIKQILNVQQLKLGFTLDLKDMIYQRPVSTSTHTPSSSAAAQPVIPDPVSTAALSAAAAPPVTSTSAPPVPPKPRLAPKPQSAAAAPSSTPAAWSKENLKKTPKTPKTTGLFDDEPKINGPDDDLAEMFDAALRAGSDPY